MEIIYIPKCFEESLKVQGWTPETDKVCEQDGQLMSQRSQGWAGC